MQKHGAKFLSTRLTLQLHGYSVVSVSCLDNAFSEILERAESKPVEGELDSLATSAVVSRLVPSAEY